ncbi:MAG: fibronectin type III domain-containing protein [Candidatus Latescibacterota bacterium]|nr:fibronectin type III domain-containing protein [Candidatus Latescibacterota bacterium]
MVKLLKSLPIVIIILATRLIAETNADYTAKIEGPNIIREPLVGQTIEIPVFLEKVTKAKGGLVTAHYDPTVVEFMGFSPKNFIPGLLALPDTPKTGDDGFNSVKGGGTQLGGTPAKGSGLFGIMSFKLKNNLTTETFISITEIQVQVSADDRDYLTYPVGRFGVLLKPIFSNQIFDLEVVRGDKGASITWLTKKSGIIDTLSIKASGDDSSQVFTNPVAKLIQRQPLLKKAAETLISLGIIPRFERDDGRIIKALKATSDFKDLEITREFVENLRMIVTILGDKRHVIKVENIKPNTQYKFEVQSLSLKGAKSQKVTGSFKTRTAIDKRPLFVERFSVNTTPKSAVIRWFTNRPADTRYIFNYGDNESTEKIKNIEGTKVHKVELSDLSPGTKYEFTIASRLLEAETLLTEGLKEDEVQKTRSGFLKTQRAGKKLRFIGPPSPIVGSDNARLRVRLSQPAALKLEYGSVEGDGPLRTIPIDYTDSTNTEELLTEHDITLVDLESANRYRFRLQAYNSDDTLTTDPRGNKPWSRDFFLRTSAASDTLDPVITEGPQVDVRGNIAIIRFSSDVPTKASVFVGAVGNSSDSGIGILGTADEVEIPSLTPNGGRRFARRHVLTIPALDLSTAYGYRIEVEGANGRTLAFDPNNSLGSNEAGKIVRVLQPPGGSGAFTTESTIDTQFPVILSGPTVTSTTDNSAVVEWITDEPANSDVAFGADDLDDSELSGDAETRHKIILSDLESGVTYQYMVGSTDAAGNGATESGTASFTTNPEIDITAPEFTTSPQIIYKNDESATITWETNEEATGEIEFGTTTDLGTIRSLSSTAKNHEAALTNLEADKTYYYTVSTYDLSNNGPANSDTLSFSTDDLPDLEAPVITSIQSLVADSSATLAWETDEVADSFVKFGVDSLQLDYNVGDTEDITEHSITLTGLNPSTIYYYRVGSTDRANNPSTESDIYNFTTSQGADLTAPAEPTNLSLTAGATQILLAWNAPNDLDLNGFNIYRSADGADYTNVLSGSQSTIYTDLNVNEGVSYQYYVTAIDNQVPPNESFPSTILATTTNVTAVPSIPTELGTTGNYIAPTFYFTNATPFNTNGTLTYNLQVSTSSDFSDVTATVSNITEGAEAVGTGQTGWAIDRDLEELATYYWRVRAVEGDLVGPFSDTAEYIAKDKPQLLGDFTEDGSVDFNDFFLFVDFFGLPATGDAFIYDLNESGGNIGFDDFFIFVDNFGLTITGKRWADSTLIDELSTFGIEAISPSLTNEKSISVRLWARNIEKLVAFGSVIEYDPRILHFDHAKPGPGHLLTSDGTKAPLFAVMWEKPGQIAIGNGRLNGNTVNGDGLLAQLYFTLIGDPNEAIIALRKTYTSSPQLGVRSVSHLESGKLIPSEYFLHRNFPNPFNPSTTIKYSLPKATPVRLTIFNVLGQQVRSLVNRKNQFAGFYSLTWDGLNDHGKQLASGVYFYRLQTSSFTKTLKMTLIE